MVLIVIIFILLMFKIISMIIWLKVEYVLIIVIGDNFVILIFDIVIKSVLIGLILIFCLWIYGKFNNKNVMMMVNR